MAEESLELLDWSERKVVKRAETYTNCKQEWKFFQSLWPYEQSRWLYAMRGLIGHLLHKEVVRLILVDFMHCQCKNKQCNRKIAPLTERGYDIKDGLALFKDMQRLEHAFHVDKVERERQALLAQGVPQEHLFIIHANFPYDGLGALMDYKPDFRDPQYFESYINLPVYLDYTCIDIWDTASIHMRLGHFKRHMDKLDEIRREVNEKVLARQKSTTGLMSWLSGLLK